MKGQAQSFTSVLQSNYAKKVNKIYCKSVMAEPIFSQVTAVFLELQ